MTPEIDPRPLFEQAHQWFGELLTDLSPEQYDAPTPCTQWPVRTVIAHVIAATDRARVVADGGRPFDVPLVYADIPDDELATRHHDAVRRMAEVWSDPTVLDREVAVPWGTTTGRTALLGWLKEPLVHGWDVAVALGLPAEAPRSVAEAACWGMEEFMPAEARGEGVPFDPPVQAPADSGPTERLAAWLGHARP